MRTTELRPFVHLEERGERGFLGGTDPPERVVPRGDLDSGNAERGAADEARVRGADEPLGHEGSAIPRRRASALRNAVRFVGRSVHLGRRHSGWGGRSSRIKRAAGSEGLWSSPAAATARARKRAATTIRPQMPVGAGKRGG